MQPCFREGKGSSRSSIASRMPSLDDSSCGEAKQLVRVRRMFLGRANLEPMTELEPSKFLVAHAIAPNLLRVF